MSNQSFAEKFDQVKQQGRIALIPFLPAGFPDKTKFWEELKQLDLYGGDILEIGVPFSDPVADGPVIEQVSLECLNRGVDLNYIFQGLKQHSFQAKIVLMGYFNVFYQYGLDKLLEQCENTGVDGLIIPDLPLEEYQKYFPAQTQVNYIPLLGLNTSVDRMQAYACLNPPFVYFVSYLGTTGKTFKVEETLLERLKKAKTIFSCPLVLGFGISSSNQLGPFAGLIDGVVFGTSLIKFLQQGGNAKDFLQNW
ncbi:MAG: tryptophan synthase subunit alpha [Desulfonauticus sp.]|nr:tryptophan synthase subunit alpha [Desulfonauticus sp.]